MPTGLRMRWTRVLPLLACGGVCFGVAGWVVTDRLERNDDFCNACHLEPGVPLHIELRRDFDARPAASLVAAHAGAGNPDHDDGQFRCIDCHGGVSAVGKLRVKTLAAVDAFWWLIGRYEEPDSMAWPLWDEDCRQCHAAFAPQPESESWRDPAFHALAIHNVDLGIDCVTCHRAHVPGGAPEAFFLHGDHVRSQCALCHPEFEEGT